MSTVLDALNDDKTKLDPLAHRVTLALVPEHVHQVVRRRAEVVELDTFIKSAVLATSDDELDEVPSPQELKRARAKLTAAKRELKTEQTEFATRLSDALRSLNATSARVLVQSTLLRELHAIASDRVVRHRVAVSQAFETWWDKYRVSLRDLEKDRVQLSRQIAKYFAELGYE